MFRRRDDKDYYEILQVDPRAEPEVIEAAYRRLSQKYHPDNSGNPATGYRVGGLNEAYNVLSDPGRRKAYDLRRALSLSPGWSRQSERTEELLHRLLPWVAAALLALVAVRFLPLFIRPPILIALAFGVAVAVLALKLRRR